MINQAIHIDQLVHHLLCNMQCHLNGVHISEVPKFLAETPSERTHAEELVNSFNAAHPLIIQLQLSGITVTLMCFPQVSQNMKMKRSQRFISLQRSHLGTHQQVNSQRKIPECLIIKVRSVSLPQWQGD